MSSLIYDYETLSQNAFNAPVVNLAALEFDEERYIDDPYTWQELLGGVQFIKFNVEEQVKEYGRKIEQGTLQWWKQQDAEVQKQLKPSSLDVSIDSLYDFFMSLNYESKKKVWTRGNSFDPVITDGLLLATNKPKFKNWWAIRDTRSFLEGMLWGSDIKNNFVFDVDGFIAHDPKHDIAMDVYRMQYVVRKIYGED